jgi:hypothetical protein
MVLIFHFAHPDRTYLAILEGWKDLVIVAALIAAVANRANWAGQHLHWIDLCVLALIAVALLSIPLHSGLDSGQQLLALRTDFVFVPLYFLGRFTATTPDLRLKTLRLLAVVGICVGLVALVESFYSPLSLLDTIELPGYFAFNFNQHFQTAGGVPYSYFTAAGARRVGSVFLSPVGLGESSAVTLAAAVALFLQHGRHRRLAIAAFTAAIGAAALSSARTELLVIPVLVGGAALVSRRPRVLAATAVFIGVALSAAVAAQVYSGVLDLNDPSGVSHLTSLSATSQAITDNPLLGEGLGSSGITAGRAGVAGGEGQFVVLARDLGDVALLLACLILIGGSVVSYRMTRAISHCGLPAAALLMMLGLTVTFPLAEIFSNVYVVSACFWTLGQVVRMRADSGRPISAERMKRVPLDTTSGRTAAARGRGCARGVRPMVQLLGPDVTDRG